MKRAEILEAARVCVCGEREQDYGTCYCCGAWVPPGYGRFERHAGHWRIKCVKCASGRVLTDKDPGVKWAQRAAKEARNA